jgi:5-hydroxyisourate hydrolase
MIICSAILTLVIFYITKAMSLHSIVDTDPYQLSTHVLDVSKGKPASNVTVHLYQLLNNQTDWKLLDSNKTDANGRIKSFLPRKVTQLHYMGINL